MKIVSLILARGGSKGIPSKNIIDLNGNHKNQMFIQHGFQQTVKK